MPVKRLKLIVIIGPTASGKSELAVRIARKLRGEIISADSRQIYRGLDVGSAKVPGKWKNGRFIYKGTTHYCLDFINPKKTFTAAGFKKYAEEAIKDITSRGKIPIIVGGTGFWINALIYNLSLPAVPPNQKLRKVLEKKNPSELLKILKKLDSKRANTVEKENPRRLIRAIEIAKTLGKVPKIQKQNPYKVFWMGLNPPAAILRKNVEKRSRFMISHGIIQETKNILKQGVSKKRIKEFGFEYIAALDYIGKKISKIEFYNRLVHDTTRYAKKQMMWWKHNPKIGWFATPRSTLLNGFPIPRKRNQK